MKKIVLATSNKGKVAELQKLLAPLSWQLITQAELGVVDADETGLSFIENAILKARHTAQMTGLPALADDSGLAVAALAGAPGIYSARYAGVGATDNDNIDKLLAALVAVPSDQRQASFHCVLAFMRHADDPCPLVCHGQWHGVIAEQPAGSNGFGYDPVFWLPEHNCSAAQLRPEVKQNISHRGQALQQLLAKMAQDS
jgi:XTP/dITP diphosphohydrolase